MVNFDRAAEFYDATRGYAPGTAERIRDALVAHTLATTKTPILEVGIGTGRVALPFIRAGYNYSGLDISPAMMSKLQEQLSPDAMPQLVQGSVYAMPFADASFEIILAVHVYHLLNDLRAALLETKRVLKPGGQLMVVRDEGGHGDTGELARVRRKWMELLKELGQPGLIERERRWEFIPVLVNLAQELKITYHELDLLEHSPPAVSPREMAHRFRDRMYSSDWDLPVALHAEAYRRLEAWLAAEMPNADAPQTQSVIFKVITLRF